MMMQEQHQHGDISYTYVNLGPCTIVWQQQQKQCYLETIFIFCMQAVTKWSGGTVLVRCIGLISALWEYFCL